MKKSKILSGLFFCIVFFTFGCKKEEGIAGKKVVEGIVYYKNGATGAEEPASSAVVFITYGATDASAPYDQTTVANSAGKYIVKGLTKGDYFITAEFTDSHGFKYSTPGYVVAVNNKKKELNIDIHLE